MIGKSKDAKDPKANRHEVAKQKCRIYQRSMSGKFRTTQSKQIVPIPGQFALQKNRDLTLTTNIKSIMRDNHPESATNFLSQNVSRKVSLSRSTKRLSKAPSQTKIQSDLKNQSIRQVRMAFVPQKKPESPLKSQKKNSYLIKSRAQIPKFAQGYRIMKIQGKSQLKLNTQKSKLIQIQSKQQQQQRSEQTQFLPVQYYLLQQIASKYLMQNYKLGDSQYVLGYSRWYDLDGKSSWRKCRVLTYLQQKDRWQIEWLHNGKQKQVSRINLYFEGQNRNDFQKKINAAQLYRKMSEIYWKYNLYVDQMKNQTHSLSSSSLQKIVAKIVVSYHRDSIQKLFAQLNNLYIRSNHQAQFNAALPFNSQRRQEFQQFLPKFLFEPNQQYKMRYNISKAPEIPPVAKTYFQSAANAFKQRTSLVSKQRLFIIQYINNFEEDMRNTVIVEWRDDRCYRIDQIIVNSQSNLFQLSRRISCATCDIEHHIGNELDQLYLHKKSSSEEFQIITNKYSKFMKMITIRMESSIRAVINGTMKKICTALQNCSQQQNKNQQKLKIQVQLIIKDGKVQYDPSIVHFQQRVSIFVDHLRRILGNLPCPTKSYLPQLRVKNIMRIVHKSIEEADPSQNQKLKENQQFYTLLISRMNYAYNKLANFLTKFSEIADSIMSLISEIRRQMQKKCLYSQIGELAEYINNLQIKLSDLVKKYSQVDDKHLLVQIFLIKIDQVLAKLRKKHMQGRRELYKFVLQRILKENQKLQKSIDGLEQKLEVNPANIIEMLNLQKLVREECSQQMDRIYNKLKEIPGKLQVLELIDQPQYRDFQACHKIYILPIKMKQKIISVKRDLESTYRKRFGEELNRDAGRVILTTRQCGQQLLECLKIEGLNQMCEKFMQFSNLHQKIEKGLKQAQTINDRQAAMSWAKTDFGRLRMLSLDFAPHYTLITLAKNYQLHLNLLASGPFQLIQHQKLQQQLSQAKSQLFKVRDLFNKNPKMSKISIEVEQQYKDYSDNLPLIKALRNPDLRQRHWVIIRQVISINPQDESVSLQNLIDSKVNNHIDQLQQISNIASRQLVYQKRLFRLKRQWKQIKLILAEGEGLRTIVNVKQLRQRVEADIFQIQEMLSATFIKFLETEILCWRNQVLYRAYELLERWERVQSEVMQVAAIFGKQRAIEQLPGEYIRFQILQKSWRGLCAQVEPQPWLADVLQGRAFDSLGNLSNSMQRIKKRLYAFFEDKKRQYARLACLSDDQFVNLLSCDQTDPSENAVFQQTVRKCFQNIKTLIWNESHQIIQIKTRADEQIPLSEGHCVEKIVEYVLPDQVIMDLQRRIQKQLRISLQSIVKNPHNHTAQVLLLYQRLNFTLKIQQQIIKNQSISAMFLRQMELYRDDLVAVVVQNAVNSKSQSQLLQTLYHLQIASTLWQYPSLDVNSFQWLSQPRTYMRDDEYVVQVGLLTQKYGFQIVDLDQLVTEEWSARVYCSYAGVIRQRGFCIVGADSTVGKTVSIKKLAALFGHKQFILDSHPLVSSRNLLEYLRMAASGIWVIMRNLQRLTTPQLSILARNIQVCWVNHLTRKRQGFSVDGTGVQFKCSLLKIFATVDLNFGMQSSDSISQARNIKQCYRVVYLPRMNFQFVVEVKLLVLGLQHISSKRLCAIIEYLRLVLRDNAVHYQTYSQIYLMTKIFQKIVFLKKSGVEGYWGQEVIELSVVEMINDLIKEEELKFKVMSNLHQHFRITSQRLQGKAQQSFKQQFISLRYHYNQQLLQAYSKLVQTLETHSMIILVAPNDTGKTTLLNMLCKHQHIDLKFICPNAYQNCQLYGNDVLNGVISCLIEEMLKQIKINKGKPKGLVFDGQFQQWIEPLVPIVSSGHIIQPNGNTLLIQQDIKFIFECRSISRAPPSLLLHAAIITINDPLKWQNQFTWYLNTQIHQRYRQTTFVRFTELFIPYIVDPLIQFYQSNCSEYKTSKTHCYVPSNNLILSLLRLYESLLDYHFLDQNLEQLTDRDCSDCFNLFVMALVWTIGVMLPQETRRSFSRHFKYLIKRAIQVNIQGISKETLPEDDHDLFKIYYAKDKWQEWSEAVLHPLTITPKPSTIFITKPEDIGLAYILQRYLQKANSVFIIGFPATQKTVFLQGVLSRLSGEVYNIRKVIFSPNSQVQHIKQQIQQQMLKQKYSYGFNGFVHGKKTLLSISDLNLPMVKNQNDHPLSAHEFIRHYYITGGWYLKDSPQHYSFKNILFCGTMNLRHSLPTSLLKNLNLVFRTNQKDDLSLVISNLFSKSILGNLSETFVALICNLHIAIMRQMSGTAFVVLQGSDAISISRSLIKMGAAQKMQVLRRWIFLSQKIYQQKLQSDQSQRLFYLINNVLMEEQKIRYKSIKPNPSFFSTYYPNKKGFVFHNLGSLKADVEQICREALDETFNKQVDKTRRKQSKLQQFASYQLKINLQHFNQHTVKKGYGDVDLKPNYLKLIAHLSNTLQVQSSFIIALSVCQNSTNTQSIDLQECLQMVALNREAKLVDINLTQVNWGESKQNWKGIMLGVVEQILSSMERGQVLREIIIFLDQFTVQHDYILDDFIKIKRLGKLPFKQQAQAMFEYYVDNFGKQKLGKKGDPSSHEADPQFYGTEGKSKLRERKYEIQRKERQKNIANLHSTVLSKIKAVVNICQKNLKDAKLNPILNYYKDSLRQFSILNMIFFSHQQSNANRKWKIDIQPSMASIKSKTMITDLNKEEEEEVESQNEEMDDHIDLDEEEENILELIDHKMMNKFCLQTDQKWLRNKNGDIKLLYFGIKHRLDTACSQSLQLIELRMNKITALQQFRKQLLFKKASQIEKTTKVDEQYQLMKKQKLQREMQYEKCMAHTQSIHNQLMDLHKQKQQYELQYERHIQKVKEMFVKQKEQIIEMIKLGRDKKIFAINIQFKIYLQMLGVAIDKKIKKDQELYKEIIKDINNATANSKICKKISHILVNSHFNVPERIVSKIKELIKEIEGLDKRNRIDQDKKEQSFLDKFIRGLKLFFNRLIEFYSKIQQKEVKECIRRLNQNERTEDKMKEAQTKNIKSNQYKNILEGYESIRKNMILLEKQIAGNQVKKKIGEFIIGKIQHLFTIKNQLSQLCQVEHSSTDQCNFICWVKSQLEQQRTRVISIRDAIKSYAFTIALMFHYKFEGQDKQLMETLASLKRSRSKSHDFQQICFVVSELNQLKEMNKLNIELKVPLRNSQNSHMEESQQIASIQKTDQQSSSQLAILSWLQFVPGIIVLGLQRGSLSVCDKDEVRMGLVIDQIKYLYGEYAVTTSDLVSWLRNRNNLSNHKICFSSRVTLQNKSFPKSMRSIVKEQTVEGDQKICLVWASSKEQSNNLIKIAKRENLGNQLTVIIVTESENISDDYGCLVLRLDSQDSKQLHKKIERIVCDESQKNQFHVGEMLSQHLRNREELNQSILQTFDSFNHTNIEKIQGTLDEQLREDHIQSLSKYVDEQTNKKQHSQSEHGKSKNDASSSKFIGRNQIKILNEWLQLAIKQFSKGVELLSEQQNIVRLNSQKKKSSQTNQSMTRYLIKLYETIYYFQQNKRLPNYLSAAKFSNLVKQIFSKYCKQGGKKGVINSKVISQLHLVCWNYLGCLYPQHQLLILAIHIFTVDSAIDYSTKQTMQLLGLCLQNYDDSRIKVQILKSNKKQNKSVNIVQLLLKKTDQFGSTDKLQDSDNEANIQITQEFQRKFKKLEQVLGDKSIEDSVNSYKHEWLSFLNSIDETTTTIPESMLHSKKILVFYFITLVQPDKALRWLQLADTEGYIYKEDSSLQLINSLKGVNMNLTELSYHLEWAHCEDRLQYAYHHLHCRQSYLVNANIQKVVEMCVNLKVNYVQLDFSTIFLKLYKNQQKNQHIQPQQDMANQAEKVQSDALKQQTKIYEQIKNQLRGDHWIIININYHRLLGLTSNAYLSKINILIQQLTSSQDQLSTAHLLDGIRKSSKATRTSASSEQLQKDRLMIIYLLEVSSGQQLQGKDFTQFKQKQAITSLFLQSNKCYIDCKSTHQNLRDRQLNHRVANFRQLYYFNLIRSKKGKKQYQKLTFSQKKIIYEYVYISQNILNEVARQAVRQQSCIFNVYLEQIISKIYGCIGIVKSQNKIQLNQSDEQSLKKLKSTLESQVSQDSRVIDSSNILLKMQEYILLLLQYTFELNYKVSLVGRKIHSTHQYVASIRANIQHLSSYQLQFLLTLLNLDGNRLKLMPLSLTNPQQDIQIDTLLVNFQPEGFSLQTAQIKKDPLIKQQQDKLITIFLTQSKLDHTNKLITISKLYKHQMDQIKTVIQTLKLFNLKKLHDLYRDSAQQIQNCIGNYQKRIANRQKKGVGQNRQKVNTVVTRALTQFFNRQTCQNSRNDSKIQMYQFQEYLLYSLINLKKKSSSCCLFLQELRDFVKDYVDMEYSSAVKLQVVDLSGESQDQDQNKRRQEEEELKMQIRKRVQSKFSVDKLMKKLTAFYYKMFNLKRKELSASQIRLIYTAIQKIDRMQAKIILQIEEGINNYKSFQLQSKQDAHLIEDTIYSQFKPQNYIFRLSLHQISETVRLMKHIHAKQYNLQFHNLTYSLYLTSTRQNPINKTSFYYRGFSIVNGTLSQNVNRWELQPMLGNRQECLDVLIEVVIEEETDLSSEDSNEGLSMGRIWYKCPLYINSSVSGIQVRERVKVDIRQLYQSLLVQNNVYFSN